MEETKKIAEPNQTEYKMPTKAQTAKTCGIVRNRESFLEVQEGILSVLES